MSLDAMRLKARSGFARDLRRSLEAIVLASVISLCGCLSVKAPESIVIGGRQPEPVDSGRVPTITTVEQGRAELDKAYRHIRLVEDENRELTRDNAKLKRERDDLKSRAGKRD
ncbi:MAG: hypothetical protein U1D55_05735 [Phycisphaerae bacterium]